MQGSAMLKKLAVVLAALVLLDGVAVLQADVPPLGHSPLEPGQSATCACFGLMRVSRLARPMPRRVMAGKGLSC